MMKKGNKENNQKNNQKKNGEFFAFDMADPSHQKIKTHPDQVNAMELLREVTESDEY